MLLNTPAITVLRNRPFRRRVDFRDRANWHRHGFLARAIAREHVFCAALPRKYGRPRLEGELAHSINDYGRRDTLPASRAIRRRRCRSLFHGISHGVSHARAYCNSVRYNACARAELKSEVKRDLRLVDAAARVQLIATRYRVAGRHVRVADIRATANNRDRRDLFHRDFFRRAGVARAARTAFYGTIREIGASSRRSIYIYIYFIATISGTTCDSDAVVPSIH